jgi:hypothetical protein
VNQDGRFSAPSKGEKKGFRPAYLGSLGSQPAVESHLRLICVVLGSKYTPEQVVDLFRAPASVGCCSGAAKMPGKIEPYENCLSVQDVALTLHTVG